MDRQRMIRARNALRPDAACHSSDVLTPVERSAEKAIKGTQAWLRREPRSTPPPANRPLKWGDIPAIRAILESLRSKR